MNELKLGLELTLEQKFTLTTLRSTVKDASKEQLEDLLLETYSQMLRYKNISCQFIKNKINGEVDVSLEFITSD